jgi:hypothetical protein
MHDAVAHPLALLAGIEPASNAGKRFRVLDQLSFQTERAEDRAEREHADSAHLTRPQKLLRKTNRQTSYVVNSVTSHIELGHARAQTVKKLIVFAEGRHGARLGHGLQRCSRDGRPFFGGHRYQIARMREPHIPGVALAPSYGCDHDISFADQQQDGPAARSAG